jgi:N6-adenosine-specific RNA methylase IME4
MNLAKTLPRKARLVLADPPWDWASYSRKGEGRSAKAHYDVMPMQEIKSLPVWDWVKDDCALCLWVHNSMIPDGLEVMKSWGFTYKARGFTWLKCYEGSEDSVRSGSNTGRTLNCRPFFGQGKWSRLSTELCLLGTRGKPKVMSHKVSELIVSDLREHSQKPDEIYERIEQLIQGPYLELFASSQSTPRPNWVHWIGKDRAAGRRWKSSSYPDEEQYIQT